VILDETHDPARRSWVASAEDHPDFPIQNLPLGVFSLAGGRRRAGVAIGDEIFDLAAASEAGLLPSVPAATLQADTLNPLLGAPAADRLALRRQVSDLLRAGGPGEGRPEPLLHDAQSVDLHLPAVIGDYTDFYACLHHALNVGRVLRPGGSPLLPNYRHIPIGYHGRASSIRLSGVPVRRPNGQRKAPEADAPTFGPAERLDFELELGVWIGPGNDLGEPIPIAQAQDHVAGLCLLNDWSARDIQAWEYQPLGPFLAKSFHTTISPWIVTAEALAPFRAAQPARGTDDPPLLPYLDDARDQAAGAYLIDLEVAITTAAMRAQGVPSQTICATSATNLYWTVGQMLAHHASGGCNLRPGDLLGTGTISGPEPEGLGSLIEATAGGSRPIVLRNGEVRRFLEDGDEISLRGRPSGGLQADRVRRVPRRGRAEPAHQNLTLLHPPRHQGVMSTRTRVSFSVLMRQPAGSRS